MALVNMRAVTAVNTSVHHSGTDDVRNEAMRILHTVLDSRGCTSQLDLVAVFEACVEKASVLKESEMEQRNTHERMAATSRNAAAVSHEPAAAQAAWPSAIEAAKATAEKEAQRRSTLEERKRLQRAERDQLKEQEERLKEEEAAAEAAEHAAAAEAAEHAEHAKSQRASLSWRHSLDALDMPAAGEPFVTRRAKKKARAEAVKAAEAEQEAYRQQRKETKKERRHADAAAKMRAEEAAKEAARLTSPAIRLQCAARRRIARCQRAELHRRMAQRKCFAVLRMWRHLLCRILRDVHGLSLLLRAASAVKESSSAFALANAPKCADRPSTLTEALKKGNWTHLRDTNHHVFARKVVTSEGTVKTQFTTLAKTPSDFRSNPNQLAKLRGKLEDGVEQSYSLRCADAECCAAVGMAPRATSTAGEAARAMPSPKDLILHATLLAFRQSMAEHCPTFAQRRRVLALLKEELATLKAMEARPAHLGAPTAEEQSRCKELAACRLDEKLRWLNAEMKLIDS